MWWLLGHALLWLVGCFVWYKIGFSVGKDRAKVAQALREPVCGCKHHISYHLHENVNVNRHGWAGKFRCANCTCTQYVGPLPSGDDVILGMSQQDQLQLLGIVDNTGGEG